MVVSQSEGYFDVVVLGSANFDLVANVSELQRPGQTILATGYAEHAGGKGLNQAVACARMGARTAFIGCVGNDVMGHALREVLQQEGVNVSGLKITDTPTGRAFISVDSAGENMIVVVPGANGLVGLGYDVVVPPCSMILAQLEIPIDAITKVFKDAHARGIRTVLNPAPVADVPEGMLLLCDVVVANEDEAARLGGARTLLNNGARGVVTTLGARGAEIVTADSTTTVPPYIVSPLDTTGAGDAFIGALCAELTRGSSLEEAVCAAVIAGALATTVRGAVPSLPTRDIVTKARSALT